ncbi:adenylosuccinate lyase [Mycoplasma wenyonii str. Massachusetts]|uniref:Adenylosuccinate lyase n=1 Tax=Mycoplasma wenyonii (strain Massachusetts) TaxID=1197325 RepID=I6YL85_MYCWM|nr:lyase family protein [Mycoplasma wenyonii]AFN65034.1 adenylosuccinate lyase [Mycoplasma wenyonii str. Massachusetts]
MIKRYQLSELEPLFSEEAKYKRWSLLEREVLYALKNNNILNLDEGKIKELEKSWSSVEINEEEVQAEEENTKHDFVAFLNVLEKKLCSSPIFKYLHYGLTSSDIIDSATSLFLREANNKLVKWIEELQTTLFELSTRYLYVPQIGRTHGRHAEPISFGHKFAICYQELENALEQLYLARRNIEVITIKGATGSFAHISSEIQENLAHRLGLFTILGTTQALPRNRHSAYLFALSQLGKIINTLAINLRTLAREEISEISLIPSKSQVGSSAMPHKTNPVTLENISGLTRWLTSLSDLANQNIELWDERDISHSSNERASLMDAPTLLGNIVLKMNDFLKKLRIDESRLKENLDLTKGLIHSQIVSLALLEDPNVGSRQEARGIISQMTQDIRAGKANSLQSALSDSNYKDSKALSTLSKVENLNHYLQYFPRLHQQIFKKEDKLGDLFNKYEIDNTTYYLAQRLNWRYSSQSFKSDEKVIVVSLLKEISSFNGRLLSLLTFPLTVVFVPYSDESFFLKFEESKAYKKVLELSKSYSKILVVKERIEGRKILENLYSKLEKIEGIEEIKSVSLFLELASSTEKSIFSSEYYKPTSALLDFSSSETDMETREFNFKNWTPESKVQLVNWFGFLVTDNEGLNLNQNISPL